MFSNNVVTSDQPVVKLVLRILREQVVTSLQLQVNQFTVAC